MNPTEAQKKLAQKLGVGYDPATTAEQLLVKLVNRIKKLSQDALAARSEIRSGGVVEFNGHRYVVTGIGANRCTVDLEPLSDGEAQSILILTLTGTLQPGDEIAVRIPK